MSLLKKRRMTEKRLAANRRNARLSKGPVTAAGRERIRNAHLRHGFYSKAEAMALRALGEDPADFQALLAGFRDKRTAAAALEEQLANRLARAFWRIDRADRMQEGCALRQAQEEDHTREGRLHVEMMRLKMIARSWQLLAQSVQRAHYVTTPADLEMMKNLHKEGVAKEMSEVALALFYQLREPGAPAPGEPGFEDEEREAQTRAVLQKIRAIFGVSPEREPETEEAAGAGPGGRQAAGETDVASGSSLTPGDREEGPEEAGAAETTEAAYPDITAEQWEAREPVRQLLENILTRQVEIFEAQHHNLLRQCLAGPSCYERAAALAPTLPNTKLMQRMEDANFRQILRISHVLLRMRREERLRGAAENGPDSRRLPRVRWSQRSR